MQIKMGQKLLLFLNTIIFAVLSVLAPSMALFFGIIATASYIVLLFLSKIMAFICPLTIAILVYLISPSAYEVLFSVFIFAPASLIIYFLIRRKESLKSAVLAGTFAQALSFAALIAAYIYNRGGSLSFGGAKIAFMPYINLFNDNIKQILTINDKLNPSYSAMLSDSFALLKQYLIEGVVPVIPGLLVSFLLVQVFISLVISKRVLYHYGFDVSSLGRIKDFKASRASAIFLVLSYFASLLFEQSAVATTFSNMIVVLNPIFLLAGFVLIATLLDKFVKSAANRSLILVGIGVLCIIPLGFSGLVVSLGIFGTLFDFKQINFDNNKGE